MTVTENAAPTAATNAFKSDRIRPRLEIIKSIGKYEAKPQIEQDATLSEIMINDSNTRQKVENYMIYQAKSEGHT